ncbi:amino acid adenylation domain-containing protein [Streptomyces sp. AK08-02]|uniref:non-ribosomal peptide synthetase n=1 Tax=Streptomyces sp. AK08-02 TaxID=3028654 RepID=UPI0029B0F2B7|nr:amino acid adenylation domain-containing protein [Streptomyces sp. AK08-02]MDX3751529.1 amino acid adenylation domain-containing protein [Streptomyces sp. AK08-02]
MWLLERLVPDSAANNLSLAFQTEGRLDGAAVRRTLSILFRRYEVLRTVYFANGAELEKGVVPADGFDVPLEESDGPDVPSDALAEGLLPFVNRRFAFDGRPLVRAGLFHHADGDVLCLAVHHLDYDIISGTTLLEEIVALYGELAAGREAPAALLEPVAAFHEPEPGEADVEFWRGQLEGFDPDGLDLWCGAADAADPTLKGDQLVRTLSPEARTVLRALQREVRAPEAVVLLTLFDVLLAAHGAGPDLNVGSPVSVRPPEAPRTVGHHTNVLPLRVRVEPEDGFRTLVRRVRDTYFGALTHAAVPEDTIAGLLPRAGSTWRNRLARHLFNYFPQLELTHFEIAGQAARPIVIENGYSKYDLEFFVASSPDVVQVTARYSTEKFSPADAEALLLRYEALLPAIAADVDRPVGELLVWSEQDHAVIDTANDTAVVYSPPGPANVLEAVHRHAGATPVAVAVQHGEREIGYRRLWEAGRAAHATLAAAGVGPGDVVAIAASRSPELTAAVLGVWLTGAAYLPVDPEHPAQRVAYLLADSGAKAVFTDRELPLPGAAELPRLALPAIADAAPEEPLADLPVRLDPESPAYLIYTSGSSGRPKGALLPHRAISNIASDYTVRLRATPEDATLWMTTFAFDMANLEHYVPLYSGGRIVVAPDEARTDGKVLRELIDRYAPRILQATPTTLRMVYDDVADRLAGRIVVTGAEPVPVVLAKRLLAAGAEVVNAYGPTETITWCTWGVVPDDLDDRISVGGPIQNIRMFVLAPDGRELPVGVRGEVCIAGDGVCLGYLGRPELNAERFGEHPRYGRFYRSGDLGRWLPDGTFELLGRADRQVKLRGNRIELGEIEATLLGHPGVKGAAAVVVGDRSSDGRLLVFVEAAPDAGEGLADSLWDFARAELPRAAVPQEFTVLDALPVNANEKVDHLALEALAMSVDSGAARSAEGSPAAAGDEPADPLVRDLIGLWRDLLGHDDVGPDSNFFTSGGHSLLGAKLLQRIEEEYGVQVKLADLFASPSPAAIAGILRSGAGDGADTDDDGAGDAADARPA